jgi:hypothetical protein
MVPRADRNASYLCQLANPSADLSRLYDFRLTEKHIQQIPCDADQINNSHPAQSTNQTNVDENEDPL